VRTHHCRCVTRRLDTIPAQAVSAVPRARVMSGSTVYTHGARFAPQDSRVHCCDRLRDPETAVIYGHQHAISHVPSSPNGISRCSAQLNLHWRCHTIKPVVNQPTLARSNCAPTGYKMSTACTCNMVLLQTCLTCSTQGKLLSATAEACQI
jgi:hypothetical protein